MKAPVVIDREGEEALGVFAYRYRQAIHAGLEPNDAFTFAASDGDVGLLRKLVKGGATPEQIAKIVL
jgi:hypothetical protein